MDKFLIKGPCKVIGKVNVSGSKNAELPILAATLLFDKPVELKNLPNVRDIQTMLALLKSLGSKIKISKNKNSVKIYNNVELNFPTGSLKADNIDYDFETKYFKVSMFDSNAVKMKVIK